LLDLPLHFLPSLKITRAALSFPLHPSQLADIFTKPLAASSFIPLCQSLLGW
jgi:hypothetical protein